MWKITRSDELKHHGVKGQVHGRRRWQNEDGSLTPEGRIHYGVGEGRDKSHDAFYEREEGYHPEKYSTESYRKLRKGKYKDLADALDQGIKEKQDAAQKAWDEYVDSGKHFIWSLSPKKLRDNHALNKKEHEEAEEKFKKAVGEMYDTLFSTSEKYIQEHFTQEQWDDARAFVYEHSELWRPEGLTTLIEMD